VRASGVYSVLRGPLYGLSLQMGAIVLFSIPHSGRNDPTRS
jgi:hypothetical protein